MPRRVLVDRVYKPPIFFSEVEALRPADQGAQESSRGWLGVSNLFILNIRNAFSWLYGIRNLLLANIVQAVIQVLLQVHLGKTPWIRLGVHEVKARLERSISQLLIALAKALPDIIHNPVSSNLVSDSVNLVTRVIGESGLTTREAKCGQEAPRRGRGQSTCH